MGPRPPAPPRLRGDAFQNRNSSSLRVLAAPAATVHREPARGTTAASSALQNRVSDKHLMFSPTARCLTDSTRPHKANSSHADNTISSELGPTTPG